MIMYKLVLDKQAKKPMSVSFDNGDIIKSIPFDPANTDYQAYLKWLDDGNTPEAAE